MAGNRYLILFLYISYLPRITPLVMSRYITSRGQGGFHLPKVISPLPVFTLLFTPPQEMET